MVFVAVADTFEASFAPARIKPNTATFAGLAIGANSNFFALFAYQAMEIRLGNFN